MVYWFHIYSLLLSQNGDPAHSTTRIWDTFALYRRRNVLSDSSRDLDGSEPAYFASSECGSGWSCRSGSSSCAPCSASSECVSGWSCQSESSSCAPSSASSECGWSCRSGSSSCAPSSASSECGWSCRSGSSSYAPSSASSECGSGSSWRILKFSRSTRVSC